MSKKKERKKIINKLKHKYRLIIYNDNTFEEVWSYNLSRLNVFTYIGILTILLITFVTIIIIYTPIREYIPGYPDGNMRKNILFNASKVDSLEYKLKLYDKYIRDLKNIIEGKEHKSIEIKQDSTIKYEQINFSRSKYDSALRSQIEEEEQYNISIFDDKQSYNISNLHFFPPLKGVITNPYNPSENHYGTDIVAAPNEMIRAILDGTVILSTLSIETGWIIEIQHENNIISVYKHNAELLKEEGSYVKAGDAIAIFGNSGELSTGPHLHFELWYNGNPLNPEDYIIF